MDPSKIDLHAYALGEATPAECEAAVQLLATSPEAREEFDRLQLTLNALGSLRDEELPRRIAFVSDPVFEPNLWQRFWSSTPRLGFAGAGLLAAAITAHGVLMRPVALVAQAPAAVAAPGVSKSDIDDAVAKAVVLMEAKQRGLAAEQVRVSLNEAEKKYAAERQMMAIGFEENLSILRKQMNRMYVSNAGLSVGAATPE